MATTIIMQGRQKGKAKERPKDAQPSATKSKVNMLVLCLFVFSFVPTTGPENMMNSWGQQTKKRGANWSTTHVSVLASKLNSKV
jgi:hypothetical protein